MPLVKIKNIVQTHLYETDIKNTLPEIPRLSQSNDLLLLTGTLLPESNAQIFHQLWVSPYSPYKAYKNLKFMTFWSRKNSNNFGTQNEKKCLTM